MNNNFTSFQNSRDCERTSLGAWTLVHESHGIRIFYGTKVPSSSSFAISPVLERILEQQQDSKILYSNMYDVELRHELILIPTIQTSFIVSNTMRSICTCKCRNKVNKPIFDMFYIVMF